MTGDTFLAVMENTALRHVPAGTMHQLSSPVALVPCRTGSFLIVG